MNSASSFAWSYRDPSRRSSDHRWVGIIGSVGHSVAMRRYLLGLASFLSFGAAALNAQPDSAELAVPNADPIELAARVLSIGDDRVVAALESSSAESTWLGILAAPYMQAPEHIVDDLARLAASRDPDLAPLAIGSLYYIAETLDRRDLDARESSCDSLTHAVRLLTALEADSTARADIRLLAGLSRSMLESVCGSVEIQGAR